MGLFYQILSIFLWNQVLLLWLMENSLLWNMLSFKQDQLLNELFIDTVTEVENGINLLNLLALVPTAYCCTQYVDRNR